MHCIQNYIHIYYLAPFILKFMHMQYEWKIINLLPIETINTAWGDRQKQTIVLEENKDSEYKGWIVVDMRGEKINLLKNSKVGDTITIHINSKVREYNGKFYNSITGWKVDLWKKPVQGDPRAPEAQAPYEDELPF